MTHFKTPTRSIVIAILCLCGMVVPGRAGINATAISVRQEQHAELVIKMTSIRNAPVVLSDLKLADFSVKSREKLIESRGIAEWKEWAIPGNGNWLNSLRLTFRNVSDKPVVAMEIELLLYHPRLPYPLCVPVSPDRRVPLFLNRGMAEKSTFETLKPNEEITYSLHPATIKLIAKQLRAVGATTSINEIEIEPGRIQFDYDSGWDDGQIFRRDPGAPDVWRPEKNVGQVKYSDLLVKAAYLGSIVAEPRIRQTTFCNSAGSDSVYHCYSPYVFWCEGKDESVTTDYGSYMTQLVSIICKDPEGTPCNTEFEYAFRRKLNRGCIV